MLICLAKTHPHKLEEDSCNVGFTKLSKTALDISQLEKYRDSYLFKLDMKEFLSPKIFNPPISITTYQSVAKEGEASHSDIVDK